MSITSCTLKLVSVFLQHRLGNSIPFKATAAAIAEWRTHLSCSNGSLHHMHAAGSWQQQTGDDGRPRYLPSSAEKTRLISAWTQLPLRAPPSDFPQCYFRRELFLPSALPPSPPFHSNKPLPATSTPPQPPWLRLTSTLSGPVPRSRPMPAARSCPPTRRSSVSQLSIHQISSSCIDNDGISSGSSSSTPSRSKLTLLPQ